MSVMTESNFLLTLGAGVVGGLILNVMPCVLPGLFFKIHRILNQIHEGEDARHRRIEGLMFLLGSLSTFSVFALIVVILRTSGQSLGWGMQMQNTTFVGALMLMTFLFSLNAFGLFEINLGITQGKQSNSLFAPFLEAVFITLLSTPCSAPILGSAITVALASDGQWWETFSLFWAIGLGLSLPILLVSFTPFFARIVPEPGAWTLHFKHLVGLSLVAATIWLYTQYENLVSTEQAHRALYALCIIAASFLLLPFWREREKKSRWLLNIMAASLAIWSISWASQAPKVYLPWQPFNQVKLTQILERGAPVFVDFTADWCQSCKTFEELYLNTQGTADLFTKYQVVPMQADLTKPDDSLWDLLREFNRTGIPAYVIYHPNGERELLPEGPPLTLKERVIALGTTNPLKTTGADDPLKTKGADPLKTKGVDPLKIKGADDPLKTKGADPLKTKGADDPLKKTKGADPLKIKSANTQ